MYRQKKGGGSARFQHSARCASKWRRPNHRKSYARLCGWATWGRFFCFFFKGVRVTPGAQWPASVAAQVVWQAKQTKFGFIQVYSSAPDLLFLTENRALRGGHLHDSIEFFSHAFVHSEIGEVVDRWLWNEWSSVQMRSAPCPFLLHFFCDAAEPDCVVVLVIPWHDKVNKVNDWTLTDRAWGDHFRPH